MKDHELRTELAAAHRILHGEGHRDKILGHVSVRIPGTEQIVIKPNGLGLEEITEDLLITVDLNCQLVDGDLPPHRETVLHTEAYRARPDVQSVAHLHSPHATALGVGRTVLPAVNHDAVLFAEGIPFFESPMLIMERDDARDVIQTLGDHRAVHLCNHGVLVVGSSIAETCIGALCLEEAARMYLLARRLGEPKPIDTETALSLARQIYTRAQIERLWSYYCRCYDRPPSERNALDVPPARRA